MKKHKDESYEKIVTWKKKPKYWMLVLSAICWGLVYLGSYVVKNVEGVIGASSPFWAVSMSLYVTGGIFLFMFSFGEGRKVKYRRIGN